MAGHPGSFLRLYVDEYRPSVRDADRDVQRKGVHHQPLYEGRRLAKSTILDF